MLTKRRSRELQLPDSVKLYKIVEIIKKRFNLSLVGEDVDREITSLVTHSNQINHKTLFFALPQTKLAYLLDAGVDKSVVFATNNYIPQLSNLQLITEDVNECLAYLAHELMGSITKKGFLVGVTGTNGKTTTAHLILSAFEQLGLRGASIGTVGLCTTKNLGLERINSELTTPDLLLLNGWLFDLDQLGCNNIVLEVSSHALSQGRVRELNFDVAIFTNLTLDHLDYHGTYDEYRKAKFKLFEQLNSTNIKNGLSILNIDDHCGEEFSKCLKNKITFGKNSGADCRILSINFSGQHEEVELDVEGERVFLKSPLIGEYNCYNLIGVALTLRYAMGISWRDIAQISLDFSQAPGRFELLNGLGIKAIVDYAHTPDALNNVLISAKKITPNQLWVVFGCGGNRDRSKRAKMMHIAESIADQVIITNDNPRLEDPNQIVADILSEGGQPKLIELDREKAIQATLSMAKEGDVVLVAGKGHEDYQIIGENKRYFSDQEIIKSYFKFKI